MSVIYPSIKELIAPMIKSNKEHSSFFINFSEAWKAFNHPAILAFIQQQVRIVSQVKNVETRFLLQENARDLFGQTICTLSNKLRKGGLSFDDFGTVSEASTRSWFKTVVRNAANDALKLKQPKQMKIRIDRGFNQDDQPSFILESTLRTPSQYSDVKELQRLQSWLSSLPLLIANTKGNGISPTKTTMWKLYEHPRQVTLSDLQQMTSRNMRSPKSSYQLLQRNIEQYIAVIQTDDDNGTNRKNFLVWLLFGKEYSSLQGMLSHCNQKWLSKIRDNQIRKTYGRAKSDIWTLILFRLLSSQVIDGYESWFQSAMTYAFSLSSNNFHPSRKGIDLQRSHQRLQDWCAQNQSKTTEPRFSRLQDIFAFLYSKSSNRSDWIHFQSSHNVDKITLQFKVVKRILPPHPFQNKVQQHSIYA